MDYQSLDGQPAHLFFMIAAPEGGAQTHLDALAKLSGILMDDKVRESLLHANLLKKCFKLLIMRMMKQLKKKKRSTRTRGSGRWCDKWFCKYDRC